MPGDGDELPSWLASLIVAMNQRLPEGFTGQIEVNCFRGSVAVVNVRQSYRNGRQDGARSS